MGTSDTSLQVSISTSYPTGPGVLYIDNELIKFAANDGVDTFTGLTRGYLGTTAGTHAIGRNVYGVVNDTLVGDNLVKPGLVTNGTNNFSNNIATMTFVTPQIVPNVADKGTGVNYFMTYDINPFAPVFRDLNNNSVQDPGEGVTLGALLTGQPPLRSSPESRHPGERSALNHQDRGHPGIFGRRPVYARRYYRPDISRAGRYRRSHPEVYVEDPVSFARMSSLKVARNRPGVHPDPGFQ